MERKVIQQNRTTFVVSLPKRWVEKNEVKKGDNLLINEEKNDTLTISKKDNVKKSCSISLKNLEEPKRRTIKIILNDLYKKGYDEILMEIKDEDKEIVRTLIQNQDYIGFEIFSEKKNYITISSFTDIKTTEFDSLFAKIILMTKEMLKKLEILEDKKLEYVLTAERYSKLLRRIVTKENKPKQYDEILNSLILILRSIRRMNGRKITSENAEVNTKILELFALTFEKLYYDKIKLEKQQNTYFEIEDILLNSKYNDSSYLYLWEITRNISIASAHLLSLNLSKVIKTG